MGVVFIYCKSGVMHLVENNQKKHQYTINNMSLNETVSEKDLGVHVNLLSFSRVHFMALFECQF